jgi:hypothetical protein
VLRHRWTGQVAHDARLFDAPQSPYAPDPMAALTDEGQSPLHPQAASAAPVPGVESLSKSSPRRRQPPETEARDTDDAPCPLRRPPRARSPRSSTTDAIQGDESRAIEAAMRVTLAPSGPEPWASTNPHIALIARRSADDPPGIGLIG